MTDSNSAAVSLRAEEMTVPAIMPQPMRIDDQMVRAFLTRLDEEAGPPPGDEVRAAPRFPYRAENVILELTAPDGATLTQHQVAPRNLSRYGAGLLSTQFIYPGAACRVVLRGPHDLELATAGHVVRCRYLVGSRLVYELGVQFERGVDILLLAPSAQHLRLLLVDADARVHRLLETMLAQLNAELRSVTTAPTATDLAAEPCDILLLDLESTADDVFGLIKELRRAGYLGSIVGLAVETGQQLRTRCAAVGCTGYLAKPITRPAVRELIESLRQEPLVSALAEDAALVPLINEFVTGLRPRAQQLALAAEQGDLAAVHRLARSLRADAGSYGFPEITEEAGHLQGLIAIAPDADRLRPGVYDLIHLCLAAQPVRGGAADPQAPRPRRRPRRRPT